LFLLLLDAAFDLANLTTRRFKLLAESCQFCSSCCKTVGEAVWLAHISHDFSM